MSDGVSSAAKPAIQTRLDRFKALQARQSDARKANLKEAKAETQRLATDPTIISKLERKRAIAEHKLLKDETPDFERKRAWDWTVEESEAWDKRMDKKTRHRDHNAFSDYRGEANKVYKRQVKQIGPVDIEQYVKNKTEQLQRDIDSGKIQLVADADGELIAVDRYGRINTPAENTDFIHHKPTKEAVDRLVNDITKGEQNRLKKRAERGLRDDSGSDVTYINEKNKQFNEKLARFYNKYTTEIRESFERGTAI
ncbi:pre-mRNA splicing factor syf2 [Zopfia rhizophila CBS 207.26]|uniref:Pre-mRNA-splicing factor SYF2 n=1 Tax=Zopfia rhizophila CBS 207.26 TaxID=1314779 RepID=A0A6A6E615_9PEZI|nr:pre-mRNA splicing factor syf2 [Zopfia rhizophila CBS 207.26]